VQELKRKASDKAKLQWKKADMVQTTAVFYLEEPTPGKKQSRISIIHVLC